MRLITAVVTLASCGAIFPSTTHLGGAEDAQTRYNMPIIRKDMVEYFATKPQVRVDVTVEDVTGRGEKALDFFVVEPKGRRENIPTSLSDILPRSEFLRRVVSTLLQNGSGTLKISESLSEPGKSERVNGFIGITQEDIPSVQ